MLGKLESTASINTSGVGLGLSTCKQIIEALDGTIQILGDEGSQHEIFETKNGSSDLRTKTIGTAIELTVKCKEIEAMEPKVNNFYANDSYFESKNENLESVLYS